MPSSPKQKSQVSIKKIDGYEPEAVYLALKACLSPLGGMERFVKKGQRVLLKPNLLSAFPPDRAVTTHPSVVRAAARLSLEAGGVVSLGDSPGIGELSMVMRRSGLQDALKGLDVQIADFKNSVTHEAPHNVIGRRIALAKAVSDADVIITLPKLKTHSQMVFTGALKNQYGLIVGMEKARYHYRLKSREWLAALMLDINRIAKPGLAIMDAIVGMEGMGPAGGEPRQIGALLAGADLSAVDAAACALIGLDPQMVPLLQAAKKYGFGAVSLEQIEFMGDPWQDLTVSDFKKVPQLSSILRMIGLPQPVLAWLDRTLAARPRIISELCVKCNACGRGCPVSPAAIDPQSPGRQVDDERCIRCYCCHEFCPEKAIELKHSRLGRLLRM
jgi:uncharacterized protein (DUF362 family)/Pyruvate/2-oxoacid:ferredoxin oxidoreductase delta subunit